jgi:hypothetical protein
LEGRISINTLLRRSAAFDLPLSRGELRWRRGLVLRGLEALPVAFSIKK